MESKPTLPHLMELDVIAKIGPKYPAFGTFLLNDEDGSIIPSIETKCREDPNRINREILSMWLQGHKDIPVTYTTLVRVLKKIGLSVLAQTVESSLN